MKNVLIHPARELFLSTNLLEGKKTRQVKNGKRTALDGKTWLQYSISIWNDIRKSADELNFKHPAMFPSMLAGRLIEIFSHKKDLILDPFAGSGSTLIAAQERERHSIGIEISSNFIKIYNDRTKQASMFAANNSKYQSKMLHDDAGNLLNHVKPSSAQLTVTSPPYWDILNQDRTADGKETRNYGSQSRNLGNIKDYQEFLSALKEIFSDVYKATKREGFCCVVVMDLRKKNKFYPFHMDVVNFMEQIGFKLDDLIIWDRRQEYNNLRPLGYPTVFRINKIHEYILIFKKS